MDEKNYKFARAYIAYVKSMNPALHDLAVEVVYKEATGEELKVFDANGKDLPGACPYGWCTVMCHSGNVCNAYPCIS